MSESAKTPSDGNGSHRNLQREDSQATLSTIGDVSVAATEAVGRVAAPPRKTRWLAILGFLLLIYIAASLVAIYTLQSPPWVKAFVAPLPLAVIAALAFWRWQGWKSRARDWRFREKVQQDALNSLAHETANGLNAIRANLAGFEEADSPRAASEHFKQVEQSLARIEAAVEKAVGQPAPAPEVDSKASRETEGSSRPVQNRL